MAGFEDSTQAQAGPSKPRLPASLAPFRHGIYRAIWFGTLCSNLGVWIQMVGASWLMTTLTQNADLVALVQSATALPVLLLSLPGGALADLWDRRLVFLTGQCILLGGALILALVQGLGAMTPWLLLLLTFVLNSGSALRQPAYQATVGDLVPRAELPTAIALNSIAFNMARAVGPALGGFIVASFSVQVAFVVAAACNLFIIAVLVSWRRPRVRHDLPREPFGRAMAAGFRYVLGTPTILAVMARCFVFTVMASAVWALLPLIARENLGGGPSVYGLLLGSLGAGALLGAVSIGALRRRVGGEVLVAVGSVLFALPNVAIAASPTLYVAVPALTVGGAAWMTTLSSFNIMIQLSAADWVKARALATYFMALFGGLALGSWGWGHVADIWGTQTGLALAGGGLMLSILLAPVLRLPTNLTHDLSPIPDLNRPALAPGIEPGRGSVAVTVEYRIDPADAVAYMRAMRPVRRIRLRDGALRWTLYQDSAVPERWVEAFIMPSWYDDLRRLNRLTMADRAVFERTRALHRGEGRPKVSHLIARGTRRFGWPFR
jgi:predicted MFS family arabinose efflux permease